MPDHYHYEYADERHSHSGYADERHDHYDYAEKYHRHYDLEGLIEGLRADLNAAHERIAELERADRSARSTREHMRAWADGTESHPGEEEEE